MLRFITAVLRVWYKWIYRAEVYGLENLPESGGALICCNHTHWQDPLLISAFCRKEMKFLGKKELFKNKLFAAFLIKNGGIPIDREISDVGAVKKCLRVLKNQEWLLVFPQGTRCKSLKEEDFKPGVMSMAVKTGAVFVPMGISGQFKPGGRPILKIGVPVSCETIQETAEFGNKNESLRRFLYEKIKGLVVE